MHNFFLCLPLEYTVISVYLSLYLYSHTYIFIFLLPIFLYYIYVIFLYIISFEYRHHIHIFRSFYWQRDRPMNTNTSDTLHLHVFWNQVAVDDVPILIESCVSVCGQKRSRRFDTSYSKDNPHWAPHNGRRGETAAHTVRWHKGAPGKGSSKAPNRSLWCKPCTWRLIMT